MYRIIGSVGKLKNTINEYIELNMEDTKNIICSNVFVFCSELIVNLQNNYTPEKLSLRLSLIKDIFLLDFLSLFKISKLIIYLRLNLLSLDSTIII